MRISGRLWFRLILVAVAVVLFWTRMIAPHRSRTRAAQPLPDLSVTSPLNQPGSDPAPAEAYQVYSALYAAPIQEPLVFARDSVTDIPQVGGSCLKPSTAEERGMTEAFVAANRQSHRWEQKFTIPQGYRVLPPDEVAQVQSCLQNHRRDAGQCSAYSQIRHVRFLGVPGFDQPHTRALVSVIRSCGQFCGSGGIFAVEQKDGNWQRSQTTDFTRDCSWVY